MDADTLQDGFKQLFDDALAASIGDINPDDIEIPELFEDLIRVSTYDEVGVLTTDRGLVLRFRDGAEFQVTIVRSR